MKTHTDLYNVTTSRDWEPFITLCFKKAAVLFPGDANSKSYKKYLSISNVTKCPQDSTYVFIEGFFTILTCSQTFF